MPLYKAIQNEILSIIHAINKPNCWHKALILYLVSENGLLKPNQFHCLELPRLLPYNCFEKVFDHHNKQPDLGKQGLFSLKTN